MNKIVDPALELEASGVGETQARHGPLSIRPGAAATWFDRRLLGMLLDAFNRPRFSFVLWNGDEVAPRQGRVLNRIHVRNRRTIFSLLRNPRENFGDLYSTAALEIDGSLPDFLERVYSALPESDRPGFWLWRLWRDRVPRPTGRAAARENIQHHYDAGNEFYRLWLDSVAMQYTCAYYSAAGATLEEAQTAKMHHICRKLRLQPGMRVIEAGCGWGGLARFMAREYGARVRAYNISREQVKYARERARAERIADRVEFVDDDYRNLAGQCDAFVSVGMLEHVGRSHYADLGNAIDRCLKPGGLGLIHTIGRNRPALLNGWIEKRIFPGAYPPSLREIVEIFEPHRFSVLDVENLRLHYARTLEDWMQRFSAHEQVIREMFDDRFVRTWRLYLAGSMAAFRVGTMQLFQVCFARERNNEIPWTRAHLYTSSN